MHLPAIQEKFKMTFVYPLLRAC